MRKLLVATLFLLGAHGASGEIQFGPDLNMFETGIVTVRLESGESFVEEYADVGDAKGRVERILEQKFYDRRMILSASDSTRSRTIWRFYPMHRIALITLTNGDSPILSKTTERRRR